MTFLAWFFRMKVCFPFDAVIWDVDGTLIDSEPLHYSVLRQVCIEHGVTLTSQENIDLLGQDIDAVLLSLKEKVPLIVDLHGWKKIIVRRYKDRISPSMARPEVVTLVETLNYYGVVQGCATTAEQEIVDANLRTLGIQRFMHCVVSRESVKATKPDPSPYLEAARLLGCDPERCMAVEDTPLGISSAIRAGLYTVAWPNEMSGNCDFSGANEVVSSLREVRCFSNIIR